MSDNNKSKRGLIATMFGLAKPEQQPQQCAAKEPTEQEELHPTVVRIVRDLSGDSPFESTTSGFIVSPVGKEYRIEIAIERRWEFGYGAQKTFGVFLLKGGSRLDMLTGTAYSVFGNAGYNALWQAAKGFDERVEQAKRKTQLDQFTAAIATIT